MKDFIVWFVFEGFEDYVIIKANTEYEAKEIFEHNYCFDDISEIREVLNYNSGEYA